MSALKIYLAQIDVTVGDLEGNCAKILQEFEKANKRNCDLVIFPEMALCGYDCQDLLLKEYFILEIERQFAKLCQATQNSQCAILVGAPTLQMGRLKQSVIYNSAVLIELGKVKNVINKKTLPNHGVFDEKRYFKASDKLSFVEFRGLTLAILICEDLWSAQNLFLMSEQVFDTAIVINSSPYSSSKYQKRLEIAQNFSQKLQKPLIYLNQVGAQDSLVFDGSSFILDNLGHKLAQLLEFKADNSVIMLEKTGAIKVIEGGNHEISQENSRNYQACVVGLKNYVLKSGFQQVLLGMSGGIDSALVATMAVDALGSENVKLYALPSRFNSETSMTDAVECAKNLKASLKVINIEDSFKTMLKTLGNINDLAQENLQSRIRGNILMTLSNDSSSLLLSTGNKSELACGYATLYGDMCGAFNPIKDLYKTQIYQLAKWRNSISKVIPDNIIIKEPTAELRYNQKDSDSLPDYDILDKILYALIEDQKSVSQIIEQGFDKNLVNKVAKLFYNSEYKRRQSCIGPKISDMSFDKDRRYVIINKFK